MKRIVALLTEPFTKNLHHFVAIFVLIATFNLLIYIDKRYTTFTLCLFGHDFLLAYLATAIIPFLPYQLIRKIYLVVLYIVCICYFLLGTFLYIVMHMNANCDFIYTMII